MYFLENCLGTRNAPFCMGNSHRHGLFSNIIIECNPTEMFSWRTNRKTKPMYQRREMDISLNLLYIKPHVGCTILNCKRLNDVLLSQFLLQNNQIINYFFFPTSVSKIRSLRTAIHTQGGPARSHLKSCYVSDEIEV